MSVTLGSGFAASIRVDGNLYGLDGSSEGGYFGSAAGPRGVGVLVASEDIGSWVSSHRHECKDGQASEINMVYITKSTSFHPE